MSKFNTYTKDVIIEGAQIFELNKKLHNLNTDAIDILTKELDLCLNDFVQYLNNGNKQSPLKDFE